MKGYVSIHKIVDREILVNVSKFRIYARLHGFISDEGSPLSLQILEWKELFKKYGDRILGIFKTQEDAEDFFDSLRGSTNRH